MSSYIKGLFHGLGTLLTGMKVTGQEFFTKKVTEQYPENRATLEMFDRFCGELTMPHDAGGKNKCIACGLCQSACPNETIRITTEMVTDPETGKSKRRLVLYQYDLGSCMFAPVSKCSMSVCGQRLPRASFLGDSSARYTARELVKTWANNKPWKTTLRCRLCVNDLP